MSNTNITKKWIQFKGIKYSTDDFIEGFSSTKEESILAVIAFLKEWNSNTRSISQQTSGSTGKPKIVDISKAQIKASALATLQTLRLNAGDTALLCIDPRFIGGKMMIARAIIGKLNLEIAPIVSNPLKNYSKHSPIDFFSFVPYQFDKILDESPDKIELLDNSKVIILGGAPVSDNLASKIKARILKSKVYSTYGMTETVSHVALKQINIEKEEAFKALDGVTFSIDERNCLCIHAPEISGQNQLQTNDVVNLISSTQFEWLGRYDYVINSGGIKIHPEMLEKEISVLLNSYKIKNRFFVFGLPDEQLGESMNLMLEGYTVTSDLYDLLKKGLPPFHAPKKIFSIDEFTETKSGKINRIESIKKIINA